MFLDDELLEMCRNAQGYTSESIQQLNRDLNTKCQNYYKSKMHVNMTEREVKVLLDRTFALWDSFVRMAKKEGGNMAVLGDLFAQFTFKDQLLANEQIKEIYLKLK